MSLVSVLMQKSPDWLICKELKLLYASNRLAEAVDLRDLHEHMALTKLEKFVLKRAFKQLRKEKAREKLKEWIVRYAMTGQDLRIEEELARQERQEKLIHPSRPTFTMPPPMVDLYKCDTLKRYPAPNETIIEELKRTLEEQRALKEKHEQNK